MPSSKNVHFGKLHAAHVDDPHNCGAHSGPLRQGSPHVFVQNRPLVREKDLPPCAGRPDHEPAVHCHVGEGGGSATTTQKQGRMQSAAQHKCTASGDPVDVATGRMFTSVVEFAVPALPEFACESFYSTEQAGENGPLGWGWSHSLMQRLEYDAEGLTFHDGEGRRVLFPPLGLGESVQHLDEEITLAQGNEGEFVLERTGGLTLFFVDEALTGHAHLQTVFEPGGQALVLEYADALLVRLADTLGNEYRIESDDGKRWHRLVWEAGESRPEQALVRWEYDREGNLLAAADALGQRRRFLYDASHRLVRNTDRTGYSFLFEYDTHGRCTRTRGQDGLYDLAFTYTEDPPQTTERDAEGRTTVYEYNDLGLVTRVTDAAGHAKTFTYEGAHQTARTDALGRTARYEYDPSGRVTAATAPGGGQSQAAYDDDGPVSVSAPEGETVTRTVTPEGRLVVTAPSAAAPLLTVEADPDEGCLVVEDGAGQASRLFPDEAGRLLAAETPLGRTLTASYDDAGHLAGLTDGAGRAVGFQYDQTGRLTAIERTGGSGVYFAYDPEGSLTHFTDGAGNVTRFEYAGFQQLRSVTPPGGSAVQMEYDDASRLHRLSDGRGSVWQFDYDPAGRVERLLHPDGSSEVFSYDPAGQVIRRTARSGAGLAYDYDLDGNLIALHGGDGTVQTFAYDPAGRLTLASCPGSEALFEYDGLGRLTGETSNGETLAYAYDPAGRLASLTLPSGETVAYAYDADGALTEVCDWNGGRHVFGYDAAGALETVRAANGVTTRLEYSPLGLPEAVHLAHPGDAPLADIRLRYSAADALLAADDSALGHARFEYDPAGRLVGATGAFAEAFVYDAAGNLTHSQTASGPDDYEYDRANRLLGGPFLQCRHDADGHVTTLASPEGRLSFTYDAFGMLLRAALPTGGTAEYGYDALGRRILKRVGNEETHFLWAGDMLIGETVTRDGLPVETRDFLYPPGSWSPLAQRINGAVFCCHTDHRGAPTRLTDSNGHLAWSAAYTAFGQAHPRHSHLRQPLRLPGQYHDAETGLHQNRWRSYDPARGRYLSPDPLGLAGGLNLYAYAANDPVGQSDPLGLLPSIGDLTGHLLPPQVMRQANQIRQSVSQSVLSHLGPLRRLLPPATPRPPEPQRSVVHPDHHLPPMPAPAPLVHHAQKHHPHHKKGQHPAPAPAAHPCPKSPASPRRHAPRPAPLPSDTTPLLTAHELGQGLLTGLGRTFHFFQGARDAVNDMTDPVKIIQGANSFGHQLADVLVADPDGHKASGGALARNMGHGFVDSINPFNKPTAYAAGGAAANAVATFAPLAGEVGALNDLRVGLKAATLSRDAAEAGLKAAETVPEKAAAAAKLRAAEERVAQVKAALRDKVPGVRAVRKVKEAGAQAKQKVSAAKAAAKTAQERRGGRGEDPLAPHTPRSLAQGQKAATALRNRRYNQAHGGPPGKGQLAPAGGGRLSVNSPALGRPGGSNGVSQMAKGTSKNTSVPANSKYVGGPTVIPRTNPNGGHLPADFDLHTIAESPREQRLFQQALKNKAASRSPRPNAYQRYLQEIKEGKRPTYDQANEAWGVVQQEYFKLCRNAGINMDGVQVHHWNFNKGDFPLQATDPRNLVHTPDRQTSWNSHQAVHEATSSTSDIWSGPVDDTHQIPVDTNIFPLAPPKPPTTPP